MTMAEVVLLTSSGSVVVNVVTTSKVEVTRIAEAVLATADDWVMSSEVARTLENEGVVVSEPEPVSVVAVDVIISLGRLGVVATVGFAEVLGTRVDPAGEESGGKPTDT